MKYQLIKNITRFFLFFLNRTSYQPTLNSTGIVKKQKYIKKFKKKVLKIRFGISSFLFYFQD